VESLLDYLDIIEDIVDSSKPVPFSNKVSVEKEKLFDVISEIRLNLPNEIRQAQRIIEDHDKIINEARNKAMSIIKDAENQVKVLTSEHEIYKIAKNQAGEMVEEAKVNARDMRLSAMEYADEILAKTENMVREAMKDFNQQHRMIDDYFGNTVDMLYQNRQELRGNNVGK